MSGISVDWVALSIHTHQNVCNCHTPLIGGPQWMNLMRGLLYEELMFVLSHFSSMIPLNIQY